MTDQLSMVILSTVHVHNTPAYKCIIMNLPSVDLLFNCGELNVLANIVNNLACYKDILESHKEYMASY